MPNLRYRLYFQFSNQHLHLNVQLVIQTQFIKRLISFILPTYQSNIINNNDDEDADAGTDSDNDLKQIYHSICIFSLISSYHISICQVLYISLLPESSSLLIYSFINTLFYIVLGMISFNLFHTTIIFLLVPNSSDYH